MMRSLGMGGTIPAKGTGAADGRGTQIVSI